MKRVFNRLDLIETTMVLAYTVLFGLLLLLYGLPPSKALALGVILSIFHRTLERICRKIRR